MAARPKWSLALAHAVLWGSCGPEWAEFRAHVDRVAERGEFPEGLDPVFILTPS